MSENLVKTIYLGIGSNLGNRRKNIEQAKFKLIQSNIKINKSSRIYESLSWPNPNNPKFWNIILEISSNLPPLKLIDICKEIEIDLGRKKRGGEGAISVTANIAPKLCSDFQKFSKSETDNEIKEAERLNKILQPIHHAMFVESNPSPVKYAAKLLKLCEDDVRLPLVKVTNSTKEIVKKALHSAKLI